MKNGLFLRVSPTGKQVWWVERKNSRNRRIQRMLGEYPAMDLEAARVACARVIAEIAATGVRDVTDVSEQTLWQAFVGWGRDSHLTDSTLKKYERMLRRHTSEWLDKPLHLLTAAWLKATCESITNKYGTTSSSRQLVRIVRELANYVGLPSNPAAGMRIPVTPTVAYGQRHICTAVLPGLFEAIDMLDPYPRAYYYTLLFTGFRPSFARVMEWSLLKLEGEGAPTYRISDSAVNSGRGGAGEIPLHPYLEAELRTLRKHHAKHGVGSPYLYPSLSSRGATAPASNSQQAQWRTQHFRWSLARLCELAGIPELRCGDFRETMASFSTALFDNTFVTARLLNLRVEPRHAAMWKFGFPDAAVSYSSSEASPEARNRRVPASETLRPFVESYGDALLMLAGRLPEHDMSPRQVDFWKTRVKPRFKVDEGFNHLDNQ